MVKSFQVSRGFHHENGRWKLYKPLFRKRISAKVSNFPCNSGFQTLRSALLSRAREFLFFLESWKEKKEGDARSTT